MKAERWQRVNELFQSATERAPEERAAFLDEACQGDKGLCREVESLITSYEQAENFIESPAFEIAPELLLDDADALIGQHLGQYRVESELGRGGMGVTYLATDKLLGRRVALKVIKPGMDTKQVIARFEAERQALAMMDHPNIARVFDTGATEIGRPYFVMELVQGIRITDFCDENQLSTHERLKLFIEVCHAIQHAHQKGVIHRDLKPSNVLVTVNDGVPVPKVIDFGIAKATQGRLTDQTFFTALEQFIGTPAYMSPEQAVLTSVEVDTRSDIYSLGVLLYELLTGQTPFAQEKLLAAGLDEMRRTIREVEPVKPSTRLKQDLGAADLSRRKSTGGEEKEISAESRRRLQTTIGLLRGDLDWIVMQCLQKDRGHRYATASGLAMDLERHLNHQPVLARPDTQIYRATKFVRRHRASATFAAVVFIALIAGLTGTITEARRATRHAALAERQRHRADEEARVANEQRDFALRQLSRAEAINDLNAFLLSDAAPAGKPFTVGELLGRAERVIDRQSSETDANRVELLIAIGSQYQSLEEKAKGRELLGKAYEASRQLSEPALRAKAAAAFGASLAATEEYERGESLVSEALAELGDAPQYTLTRVFCLQQGSHVAREHGDVELGVERALLAQRLLRESGQGSPLLDLAVAMNIAESYRMARRNREAAAAFAEAFKQLSALGRGETDKAATLLNNWGLAVAALGQPLEAEQLFRRAIALGVAEGSQETVSPMLLNNLAGVLTELNRFTEAAEIAERVDARARQAGAEIIVNQCLNVRATVYRELGQLDRAGEMLGEFESRLQTMLPPGHIAFAAIASQHSRLSLARGDALAALTHADRALGLGEATPEGRGPVPIFLLLRAKVRMQLEQFEEARADAARAVALTEQIIGPELRSSRSGRAYLALGRALKAQGKLDEARAAHTSALAHLEPSLGQDHVETLEAARGVLNQ